MLVLGVFTPCRLTPLCNSAQIRVHESHSFQKPIHCNLLIPIFARSHCKCSRYNHGDNAWVLASSALVLMMTAPGLIVFYGGLVRTKNVLSTMMHSLILMAMISTIWMVFGYSMAFGEGNAFF